MEYESIWKNGDELDRDPSKNLWNRYHGRSEMLPARIGNKQSQNVFDPDTFKLSYTAKDSRIPKYIICDKETLIIDLRNKKMRTLEELKKIEICEKLTHLYIPNINLASIPHYIWNMDNLKVLDISYNNIKNIPPALFSLFELTTLNLSNNPIESIPSEIYLLKNLHELSLSNTSITKLPSAFSKLDNLKRLFINNTLLEDINTICKLKQLALLEACANRIEIIPNEIGNLPCLVHISLNDNKITKIPETICKLKNLKYFDMNNNPLNFISDGYNLINLKVYLANTYKSGLDSYGDDTIFCNNESDDAESDDENNVESDDDTESDDEDNVESDDEDNVESDDEDNVESDDDEDNVESDDDIENDNIENDDVETKSKYIDNLLSDILIYD